MNKKPSLNINKSLREFYDSALAEKDELDEASIVSELDSVQQRYCAEVKIAEGGMKQILKTYDTVTDRTVAKGIIKSKTSNEQLDKFVEEVRITAGLEHPNIIPVYDLGLTGDKQPYFTMKLIEGDDLQQVLDKVNTGDKEIAKFYEESRMLEIFLKVCDAVEYAHSKKIVHLDIKPANIQVGKFGEVLLCDWGLARELKGEGVPGEYSSKASVPDSLELSLDGKIKGSPGFMAPEQISDKFGFRSVKTDIYSLGALLFTMLNGSSPIKGETLEDTLRKTIVGETSTLADTVPEGLQAVIHKALATEPEERYKSVNKLSEEIRAYISGFATRAENAGMIKNLKLMVKRHQTVTGLSAVFVFLTVILSSYFVIKVNREKAQLIVEQKHTLEAREKASEFMLNNSMHNYYKRLYGKTTDLAFQAVELDPTNTEAWEYLGYYYLGELKAEEAIDALRNADTNVGRWLNEKAKYLETLTIDGSVSVRNAILFRDFMTVADSKFRKGVSHHINFTITKLYTLTDRLLYAELSLGKKVGSVVKVTQEQGRYSLDLSLYGKKIKDLSFITNLPLFKLSIANSNVKNLELISLILIEELDISNTGIESLRGLEKSSLKRLNLSASKVQTLHHLPDSVEVLELGRNNGLIRWVSKYKNIKKVIIPRGVYTEKQLKGLAVEIIYKD